jgi:hypothetical protein
MKRYERSSTKCPLCLLSPLRLLVRHEKPDTLKPRTQNRAIETQTRLCLRTLPPFILPSYCTP